jgi:hypothetical protein
MIHMVDPLTGKAILEAVGSFLTITNNAREEGYYYLLREMSEAQNTEDVSRILKSALQRVGETLDKKIKNC